jgi:hypothetical protein
MMSGRMSLPSRLILQDHASFPKSQPPESSLEYGTITFVDSIANAISDQHAIVRVMISSSLTRIVAASAMAKILA